MNVWYPGFEQILIQFFYDFIHILSWFVDTNFRGCVSEMNIISQLLFPIVQHCWMPVVRYLIVLTNILCFNQPEVEAEAEYAQEGWLHHDQAAVDDGASSQTTQVGNARYSSPGSKTLHIDQCN